MAEYEFKPFNLAQVYGAADQANSDRLRNQYLGMQMQQAQSEQARQEAMRNAYVLDDQGNLDESRTLSNLYKVSPQAGLEFKQQSLKAKTDQQKLDTESAKAKLEQRKALIGYGRDRLATVTDQASYDAVLGELSQLGANDLVSQMSPTYSPELQQKYLLTAEEAIKQSTPKWERVDLGGKVQLVDMNPFTNPTIKNMNLDKTATPDAIMTDTRSRSEGAANRAVTMRGQDMTNERAITANELKSEENTIKRGEKIPENSTAIRKEFDQLPEVKNYKQALPAYKAIEDAAKRNTTASDINIVYGLAKLYDPNSVVREGEYATVANSPNIPEKLKGQIQYISGGGRLTAETKRQILAEARGRMKSFEGEYESSRNNYTDIAKRSNADPSLVFPDEYKSAVQKDEAPTAPKPGSIVDGYVFKGGNPADPKSWKKK